MELLVVIFIGIVIVLAFIIYTMRRMIDVVNKHDPCSGYGEGESTMTEQEIYVCPNHIKTGGYESCCVCGGWEKDDEDYGRECTEAEE